MSNVYKTLTDCIQSLPTDWQNYLQLSRVPIEEWPKALGVYKSGISLCLFKQNTESYGIRVFRQS
jgi:hypothetical protein